MDTEKKEEISKTLKTMQDEGRLVKYAYNLICFIDELNAELKEWRELRQWGGTPEIVGNWIKAQQERIHAVQEVQIPSEKTHIVGELYRVGEYEGVPTAFVSLDKDQVRALPSLPLYRRVALVQIVEGGK